MSKKIVALMIGWLGLQTSSFAEVLLATNFDGRTLTTTTTNNDTATNLNWTLNGFADPGDLTAVPDSPFINGFGQFETNGLFETAAAANSFVPNLNIHNEGTYYVDIPLNPTSEVVIDDVSITAQTHSNAGILQGVGRELDITAVLFDSDDQIIAEDLESGQQAFTQPGDPTPITVTFDLGRVILANGSAYRLRLSFGADNNRVGNNAGFDDLEVNGTAGPTGPGLAITSIAPDLANQSVTIFWNAIPERFYFVETSTDLMNWLELTDNASSTGTTADFTHEEVQVNVTRFYRVRLME